jgi:hypothetical protein
MELYTHHYEEASYEEVANIMLLNYSNDIFNYAMGIYVAVINDVVLIIC